MTQQPGFFRRRVGAFTVTVVNDGVLELPLDTMTGIAPEDASAMLLARFRPPVPLAAVNTVLIQGRGRTVLVDTGGGAMAPGTGRMLANLAAAGVAPDEVDLVLLTHLHSDHSGMLAAPDGSAVFPRAALALSAAEAGFWLDAGNEAGAPEARRRSFAHARAAVAPYRNRMRLLDPGEAVPGITLVPLPGHTPGHAGFRVDDGGGSLLVWGDVMHVPEVQSARPEVAMVYDLDPAQAVATRRRVLDMAAADRLPVMGMHLGFPGFAHVVRAGTGFELVPETWSPTV